jgi:transcriptional regulator with XRE-family HTH domain
MPVTSETVESNGSATRVLDVERVKVLAKSRGFGAVGEMADRFGITRQYLYHLLRGHNQPRVNLALRMARELGVDLDDLYQDKR